MRRVPAAAAALAAAVLLTSTPGALAHNGDPGRGPAGAPVLEQRATLSADHLAEGP